MLFWLTIIGVWIIDRVLKVLVQGHFHPNETFVVIPKIFHLTYVLNSGAAFGLMAGRTWIFILTALLVVAGVVYAQFKLPQNERIFRFALGLIGGGALGNLYDRVMMGGKVVDYLDFQIWSFVFNFADSMIVIGVGLLLLMIYLQDRKNGSAE